MPQRERRGGRKGRRAAESRNAFAMAAVVCLVVIVGVAVAGGFASSSGDAAQSPIAVDASAAVEPSAVTSAVAVGGTVEVPSVSGLSRQDAEVVLRVAGLEVDVRSAAATSTTSLTVVNQEPQAGALVKAGTRVTVVLSEAPVVQAAAKVGSSRRTAAKWVVCIDPGHQSTGDSSPEPIGPGSKLTKPSATGGVTGAETGISEYEVALQISMNLKSQLEKRGVRVVMTRTTSDVQISNAHRAKVANRAKADLFVRVHCNGSPDDAVCGVSTLYPASNKWTRPWAVRSRRAAAIIHSTVVRATGAPDRGTAAVSDHAGFNWSEVPCLLVECGVVTNTVEDRLLVSPHYQDKLAAGMAEGIVRYLGGVD